MATGTETESGSSGSINFSDSVDRLRPPKSQPRANEIGRKQQKKEEEETGLNRMGRDDDENPNSLRAD